jgi:hypothetical protein
MNHKSIDIYVNIYIYVKWFKPNNNVWNSISIVAD